MHPIKDTSQCYKGRPLGILEQGIIAWVIKGWKHLIPSNNKILELLISTNL